MRAATAAALAGTLVATLACGRASPEEPDVDFTAPVQARAALALEPNVLHVGEVVRVEVLVVAPPGHRVGPVTPREIRGVALLGARALPPEPGPEQSTHRTRFRIRPESVGVFEWPALPVEVQPDEGEAYTLSVPARRFEVVSIKDRFAGRDEPFGLETIEAQPGADWDPGFFAGLALGVTASALAAMTFLLLRRPAAARAEPPPRHQSRVAVDLFEWTERELAEALAVLEADSRRAATAGAHLLRVYMARRFGSPTEAATTEELERRSPALAERSSWPDFVRILHSFDDERFRPRSGETGRAARVQSALEDSRRLIEASRPAAGPVA